VLLQRLTYTKPDAAGMLHRSLNSLWWILEPLPKAVKYRDWPRRRALFGIYIPWGEPRLIPNDSLVHTSVTERAKRVPDYKPVNLSGNMRAEK
jgi:hypothetical protein